MRIERVVLEHHGDVALFRRHVVDDALADQDVALRNLLEPGDHPEQRRFPAARRPDQDDELAVGDIDVHAVDDLHRAEGFADIAKCNWRHWSSLLPVRARPRLLGGRRAVH